MNKAALLVIIFLFLSSYCFSQKKVSILTNKGEIVVQLYNETPKHRSNFIKLVQEDFYDSTLFHRVIADFMIQGGDPQSKSSSNSKELGNGGPGYTIQSEISNEFIHKKGALAAARQGDDINPSRRSSGSQFYIVDGREWPRKYMPKFEEKRGKKYTEEELNIYETIGGTPHLDGQYTVFGEVIQGMNIVEELSKIKTGRADRPTVDIMIIKMELVQ